ncbi:MAG: 30S ribosomal protein S9 [Armatimonadetes bacterium]|nr:30S ribosomal protein S9 [Armatimonadota bacterium]
MYYATGRRKNATAKVRLITGKGNILINNRPFHEYLCRKSCELIIKQPLELTKNLSKFDIVAITHGGGISGQAGAIRHGISRALVNFDPELRLMLRKAGFLTRDPRMKERKKYGRKRARKSFQWTKR